MVQYSNNMNIFVGTVIDLTNELFHFRNVLYSAAGLKMFTYTGTGYSWHGNFYIYRHRVTAGMEMFTYTGTGYSWHGNVYIYRHRVTAGMEMFTYRGT